GQAEKTVGERRKPGGTIERDVPWPRGAASRQRVLESIQVQVGERDVPLLYPLGVGEAAALELLGYRDGGALVGRVEVPPLVTGGLQRFEQGRHPADQLLDHAAIMADRIPCSDGNSPARASRVPPP